MSAKERERLTFLALEEDVTQLDDDQGGLNTPQSAVLTGVANLFRLVFVTVAIAIAWLVGVCVAIYYSWAAENGSVVQGFATNCLAGLILLLVAPMLFSVVLRNRGTLTDTHVQKVQGRSLTAARTSQDFKLLRVAVRMLRRVLENPTGV